MERVCRKSGVAERSRGAQRDYNRAEAKLLTTIDGCCYLGHMLFCLPAPSASLSTPFRAQADCREFSICMASSQRRTVLPTPFCRVSPATPVHLEAPSVMLCQNRMLQEVPVVTAEAVAATEAVVVAEAAAEAVAAAAAVPACCTAHTPQCRWRLRRPLDADGFPGQP